MNPIHDLQRLATRGAFMSAAVALAMAFAPSPARADRLGEVKRLEEEYAAAQAAFYDTLQETSAENALSSADRIRRYESSPAWQFLPRFLEVAEAEPTDEAAFQACLWIIDFYNKDRVSFDAEQKAWRIIAEHHAAEDRVPMLCLLAVQRFGPAQDEFLRGLVERKDLPREHAGFATLALAESLARKVAYIEDVLPAATSTEDDPYFAYLKNRRSPEWGKDLISANAHKFRVESAQLFRTVLDQYADVPCTISMPYFRNMSKLGEKAEKSLHAIEKLRIGAKAPDIVGHDLDGNSLKLHDYRGRVVLLSFWFSGCGPCIAMVPKERELVEKFKDRPFALLGVCADDELENGRAAAKEHGMSWPCWYDGDNGPIASQYNVLSWPTFYLLDKNGRIVSKDLDRENMRVAIEKLLESAEQ